MRMLTGARAAVVGALLLIVTGLAGCSAAGGASQAATSTTAQPDRIAIWRQVIQCLRDNGMPNLPDPQFDSNGQPQFPGGDPGDPPPQAERACKPIYDRLPPAQRDDANREDRPPTDIPALLRFASCMRAHGVPDFPDPKPDGTFPVAGTSLERGKTPEGIRAGQACRQLNPDPQGRIYGSK
jgi:hypothetical protein